MLRPLPLSVSAFTLLAAFQAFAAEPGAAAKPAAESTAPAQAAESAHVIPLGKPAVAGRLVAFSAAEGLVWQGKEGVRTFKPGEVRAVAFEPKPAAAAEPDAISVLLASGDLVTGKPVAWTPEQIELDTACAGRVRLPMRVVRAMTPVGKPKAAILEGAGEAKEWGQSATVVDGVIRNNGSRLDGPTRHLPLPGQFRVEFDLARHQPFAYVTILGRGELIRPIEGTHDDYFFRLAKDDGGKFLPPDQRNNEDGPRTVRPQPLPTQTLHVVVLGDFGAKTIHLMVNGSRVYSDTFPEGFAPGKCLGFPGAYPDISGFKLLPWNGALPDAPVAASAKDAILLANGEREVGKLLEFGAGTVVFEGEARGKLKLPMARVARLEFAGRDADKAAVADGVAVEFGASDHLALTGCTLKDGEVRGEHPILGKCSFRLDEVRRLGFGSADAPRKAVAPAQRPR